MGARVAVLKQLSVEPGTSVNRVSLRTGDFTTSLLRARGDYAFSPRRFASALPKPSSRSLPTPDDTDPPV